MKIIRQLTIIFVLCLAGELISLMIPIAIPGSIIGLILLFILFLTRVLEPRALDDAGAWMLSNMALFFVPAGVSLITAVPTIVDKALVILVICIVSTILTFAATAYTVRLVMALQEKAWREKQ